MAGFWTSGLTNIANSDSAASAQNNGGVSGGSQWLDPAHGNASAYDPAGATYLNPETLAAVQKMGFTGQPFGQSGMTPQFQQWLQQQGINPSLYASDGHGTGVGTTLDLNGPNGQIGSSNTQYTADDPSIMYALAAGVGGFGALGSGLTGLSAGTDLAQGGAGLGGAAGGTYDVPYSQYTGPGSQGFQVAGDNAVAPSGFGADTGAATDAANMGLSEGAYPAGITSGGSGGGLMSQLGSAAGDAGSWMLANPGLTNIGGTLLNGLIGGITSNNALNRQTGATNSANALLAPYQQAGSSAITKMSNLLQNPSSITQDPGYQFGLQQGVQGVDRSAASKGSLYSGATLKALDRYGTDYAGTKLNQTLQNYGNVAQLGATGTQTAANNLTNLGNAGAGAAMYNGNVLQNGVNNSLGQFNYSNGGPNPYANNGQYGTGQTWNQKP
jgi:hypothetical protein